jgi:chromatin segregation and condensation protein Rec8/ScpA/Scc1 (kleisin family)
MPGMNLSEPTPAQEQVKAGFVTGSVVVTAIFFLILTVWGGMQWYIKTLDERLAAQTAMLEENSTKLKGEKVDRIASFDTRLTLMKKQIDGETTDTQTLLNQLERLVIPNVKLTKYEYNKKDKFVLIGGETDNLKFVAQQLISFKGESQFTEIQVNSLRKNLDGRVEFSFKAAF